MLSIPTTAKGKETPTLGRSGRIPKSDGKSNQQYNGNLLQGQAMVQRTEKYNSKTGQVTRPILTSQENGESSQQRREGKMSRKMKGVSGGTEGGKQLRKGTKPTGEVERERAGTNHPNKGRRGRDTGSGGKEDL
ncbi:hypothetical protein C922_00001 [Plasmodium inui San Antonio 1]|uniref:Uncharacterized protein n=1 Tax=Plasmodium inui San Antonio 1 TaxID=1237626 RepID=W7ACV7_9APIC|nr:hypothetical protein C922_00001 [Plasmodium inui San Antonio 1]EUD69138.1 hypothetical protein C922_00001 [Plasmodium inui San Antonio 1]